MLRYLTAIVLLTAFAAQTFQQGIIVLGYYADTVSFAKNCENKARPKMHCNGKCQMMKKMKEEEKKEQQNPERKLENKAEIFSSKSHYPVFCFEFSSTRSFLPAFSLSKEIKMPRLLLRPPIG